MSSWFYLEGKFNGVTDRKTLNNGTKLATFDLIEESRGAQEAATFSATAFKDVATAAENIAAGTPVVAKCKLDSRSYKDKNGTDRRATELKVFALYVGASAHQTTLPKTDFNVMDSIPF